MTMKETESILESRGVKPTPNRLLVARVLSGASAPLSLLDIETQLDTVDRSSVFRTLMLFVKAGLVHEIDDGTKSVKYELCTASGDDTDNDLHVHFHCLRCHRTFCLEDVPVPEAQLPAGYVASQVNYVIKGTCPDCADR